MEIRKMGDLSVSYLVVGIAMWSFSECLVLMAVGEGVIGDSPDRWVSRAGTYAIGCEEGMVHKTTGTGLMTIYIFDPSTTESPRFN